MTKTATITIRVAPQLKKESEEIFDELGLTTTQAISLFLKQTALNKGLPFAVEIPNEDTIQAIEDGMNKRNTKTFENAEAALQFLGL
ncbi:MAG: type II toxin-antitoxin system RelB/DinJ family antitoxin [Anaerolineae bacterium]|nr:type II toxin-antitoxin system RelB/DinJ family antitoxin [Anaerolineae bacterium]